jgi:hypothetical protein
VGTAVLRPNDVSPNLIRRGAFAQRSGRAGGPQWARSSSGTGMSSRWSSPGSRGWCRLRLGVIRDGRRLRPRKRLRGSRIRRTPRAAPDAWPARVRLTAASPPPMKMCPCPGTDLERGRRAGVVSATINLPILHRQPPLLPSFEGRRCAFAVPESSSSQRMRTRFTQRGGSVCGQRLASLFSTLRARVASCPVLNRVGDQITLTRSSTRMVPVASATA